MEPSIRWASHVVREPKRLDRWPADHGAKLVHEVETLWHHTAGQQLEQDGDRRPADEAPRSLPREKIILCRLSRLAMPPYDTNGMDQRKVVQKLAWPEGIVLRLPRQGRCHAKAYKKLANKCHRGKNK